MVKPIKFGRDNIALTVFVNEDCKNNCSFCITKQYYNDKMASNEELIESITTILRKYPQIKELVFTGGEPARASEFLKQAITAARGVRPVIKVYINTELRASEKELVDFGKVIKHYNITGVSISRHSTRDILPLEDEVYRALAKHTDVRLNHMFKGYSSLHLLEENFTKDTPYSLNLREDYTKLDLTAVRTKNLDTIYGKGTITSCEVCQTHTYKSSKGASFTYHKGLASGSLIRGSYVIVNDVVIKPNGDVMLDWETKALDKLPDVYKVPTASYCGVRSRC